jgi:hypothetical protein
MVLVKDYVRDRGGSQGAGHDDDDDDDDDDNGDDDDDARSWAPALLTSGLSGAAKGLAVIAVLFSLFALLTSLIASKKQVSRVAHRSESGGIKMRMIMMMMMTARPGQAQLPRGESRGRGRQGPDALLSEILLSPRPQSGAAKVRRDCTAGRCLLE